MSKWCYARGLNQRKKSDFNEHMEKKTILMSEWSYERGLEIWEEL